MTYGPCLMTAVRISGIAIQLYHALQPYHFAREISEPITLTSTML